VGRSGLASCRWAALAVLILLLTTAPAAAEGPSLPNRVALLQGLDKVTARVSAFQAPVGGEVRFGTLEITARACLAAPPTEPPESAAFLEIRDVGPVGDGKEVFSGWMFASSPALSALEHPVYDVWVVGCADPLPEPTPPAPGTPPPASGPSRPR
jgi:hypothetical protein